MTATAKHTRTPASSSSKKRRQSVKERARLIINDAEGYDAETRQSISHALRKNYPDLAEMVRRAEAGEEILDLAAVSERHARSARLVKSLFDREAAPDWLTNLVMRGLELATEKTGIRHYGTEDFDLRGLADLLAVTNEGKFENLLEFEPKKDLPELLSAVLKHPDLPPCVYNGLSEALTDITFDSDSAEYIRLALAFHAQESKEGEA